MLECVYFCIYYHVSESSEKMLLCKNITKVLAQQLLLHPWESGKTRLGKLLPPDQSRRVADSAVRPRHAMVADPEYHWSLPAERGGFKQGSLIHVYCGGSNRQT